jgi:hypothetical protein
MDTMYKKKGLPFAAPFERGVVYQLLKGNLQQHIKGSKQQTDFWEQ